VGVGVVISPDGTRPAKVTSRADGRAQVVGTTCVFSPCRSRTAVSAAAKSSSGADSVTMSSARTCPARMIRSAGSNGAAFAAPAAGSGRRVGAMSLSRVLDTLLDRTIVPGYSRLGYAVRQSWWPADSPAGALDGRTVVITGANSGLGKATTIGAARLGATVRMLCRDTGRGDQARAEVLAACPGAVVLVDQCDLSDLASVRAAAARLGSELPGLHALVHNAGVLPPERTVTPEGHELTVATHVLGPHLLTAELRPALAAEGDARVVFVSSGGMYAQRLRSDDPEFHEGTFDGTTAYARTKRMQVVLAQLWAQRLADQHVAVHAMHPGWADTPGIVDSLPRFAKLAAPILRSPEQGADTVVWLLAADEAGRRSGLFWHDRRPRPTSYVPFTRPRAAELAAFWDYCTAATGVL
jgi:dehydrogenase/reductase SDR family protein 12